MAAFDVAAGGTAVAGLLLGLATVGAIGTRVDAPINAATGSVNGCGTVCGLELPEPPRGGLGCLVRGGLGAVDGVDDDGAVGEDEGTGAVAVGEDDGAGGVADGEGVGGDVDSGAAPEVSDGAGLGAATATPPDEQAMAAAAPAVIAPRTMRALRPAPRT